MAQFATTERSLFAEVMECFKQKLIPNLSKLQLEAVGCFSVTKDRLYRGDMSELRLISAPLENSFPIILTNQVDSRYAKKFKHFYGEYLDHILQYIFDNPNQFLKANKDGTGFHLKEKIVTHVEALQKLMCTPYNHTENWCIVACRLRGTIYMCLEYAGEQELEVEPANPSDNLMTMETVFKHFMHRNISNMVELEYEKPEGYSEFDYVHRSTLNGKFTVLYDSPMSGAFLKRNGAPLNSDNLEFIESKLALVTKSPNGNIIFGKYDSKQTLQWWTQCYLRSIQKIYVGCVHSVGGHSADSVECLQFTTVDQMRETHTQMWSAEVCKYFLRTTLQKIESAMDGINSPLVIYQFNYDARSQKIYLDKNGSIEGRRILPDWYLTVLAE